VMKAVGSPPPAEGGGPAVHLLSFFFFFPVAEATMQDADGTGTCKTYPRRKRNPQGSPRSSPLLGLTLSCNLRVRHVGWTGIPGLPFERLLAETSSAHCDTGDPGPTAAGRPSAQAGRDPGFLSANPVKGDDASVLQRTRKPPGGLRHRPAFRFHRVQPSGSPGKERRRVFTGFPPGDQRPRRREGRKGKQIRDAHLNSRAKKSKRGPVQPG